jgi:hypothetical protein
VLHDLAVLAADYESYVSKGLCGADLSCKNSIQMQAAQAADCSRKKLDAQTVFDFCCVNRFDNLPNDQCGATCSTNCKSATSNVQ